VEAEAAHVGDEVALTRQRQFKKESMMVSLYLLGMLHRRRAPRLAPCTRHAQAWTCESYSTVLLSLACAAPARWTPEEEATYPSTMAHATGSSMEALRGMNSVRLGGVR
jgi:hypothetical protein